MPKGIVRDVGGQTVALLWNMRYVYDTHPGEVFFAALGIGWSTGHSFMVYAPLIAGCTSFIYEGKPTGTPDASSYWRVVSEYGAKTLMCSPTALRSLRHADPQGALLKKYDLSSLKYVFVGGEPLDAKTQAWATELLGVPIVEQWEQAETGWPMASNCMGIEALETRPGTPTKPVPGFDVHVLDGGGRLLAPGQEGILAIKQPLPPGAHTRIWAQTGKFVDTQYTMYPGYYYTGDAGFFDEEGYLHIKGRVDDTITVAGYRLSTGAVEGVVADHPAVAECTVLAMPDELRSQAPVGLVVLQPGVATPHEQIANELSDMIKERLGAVASYQGTIFVSRLPKTHSGKIMRNVVRRIVDGQEEQLSTIQDPGLVAEIREALRKSGLAQKSKAS
jgi:propionyl-CoA synthetase